MTAPGRDEAIQILEEGCAEVDRLLSGVADDDATRPRTIGGGEWSARDLIGHLAFWEELAVEALEQRREGVRPRVEQLFSDGAPAVDAANEENYRTTVTQSLEGVRARKAAAHAAIVAAIRGMADEEWRRKAAYETERRQTTAELLGGVLGAPKRPFGHAYAHLPDLEAFVQTLR